MAEKLADAGPNQAFFRVNVDEVQEQDINARVMPPEMMERLTETIKKDGRLEQPPFAVQRKDHFELISGHHRVRAARAAGLTEIIILADTRDLTKSQVRAKQIAHNRIGGEDDSQTLAKLYAEMTSIDDILESYLRPEDFDDVKQLDTASIQDISLNIPWKHLTLVFMPAAMEAIDRIDAIIKKMPRETDVIGVVSIDILERFRKASVAIGRTEDVRSLGAIVTRMTEIVEAYLARTEVPAVDAGDATAAPEPASPEVVEPGGAKAVDGNLGSRKPRSRKT